MYMRLYRVLARAAHRAPLVRGRLAASLAGRRSAAERWLAWAAEHRGRGPLLWLHGASVGEGLALEPVVTRLQRARPDLAVVHSFTSRSAAAWPWPFEALFRDYLPLDEPDVVARVLESVRPSLLTFSRGDLWPELSFAAAARGVPISVAGATVRPGSRRLNRLLSPLYASVSEAVSWLGAATEADAERWVRLGLTGDAVCVTGDPRHDQVLERVPRLEAVETLLPWAAAGPALVAGSTEEADLRVLAQAARRVLEGSRQARLIVVPHDPSQSAVGAALRHARRSGLQASVWDGSASPPPTGRVLVVAATGLLFDLYALGAVAYVGGGFRRRGLHAVIEPAAYGLPVALGPLWEGFSDAEALLGAGGAVALPLRRAGRALEAAWTGWLKDGATRRAAGLAARGALHQGAAAATASALMALLPPARRPTPPERPTPAPRHEPEPEPLPQELPFEHRP
jgi:3-deoxy-D-manno-octulosonic-acid transferase